MERSFNVTGACDPRHHYMVNLQSRLKEMKRMVDRGDYFTINRARQYGKTTILHALKRYLDREYAVISADFQLLSHASFKHEAAFVRAFSRELSANIRNREDVPEGIKKQLALFAAERNGECELSDLFFTFSDWCELSEKPVVLMIDEVDSAANNQVFLDFLAQLRGYYMHRAERPAFQSVILAGVYDIKNLRRKIRAEEDHKVNSPWNIAADFTVDMSFSREEIAGMLGAYEADHSTGMDIGEMAGLLYDYTSGYPFLVSRLCWLMDQMCRNCQKPGVRIWTRDGFNEAVKQMLSEKNPLFESLVGKLTNNPSLNGMLKALLFTGKSIVYNADNQAIDDATMFGFIKNQNGAVAVANRIFEMRLYNLYLSDSELQELSLYKTSLQDRNQFIADGTLNMRLVLEKFVIHFNELYQDSSMQFLEEEGRKYFLLYLRPIINGTGNYYIESRTRGLRRTDVIVDYRGKRYIIELKIWHGEEYNSRGERQLVQYLEDYHQDTGYMLSFNFNKKKEPGVREMVIGDKTLIEAVV